MVALVIYNLQITNSLYYPEIVTTFICVGSSEKFPQIPQLNRHEVFPVKLIKSSPQTICQDILWRTELTRLPHVSQRIEYRSTFTPLVKRSDKHPHSLGRRGATRRTESWWSIKPLDPVLESTSASSFLSFASVYGLQVSSGHPQG